MFAAIALNIGLCACTSGDEKPRERSATTMTSAADPSKQELGQAPAMQQQPTDLRAQTAPSTDQAQAPVAVGVVPNANSKPGENPAAAPVAPSDNQPTEQTATRDGRKAEADVKSVRGVDLEGKVTLQEVANGVRLTLKVQDAPPGKRGVRIHEKGDCSDIAGDSMGKGFAPTGGKHGLPGSPERQTGDLGNIAIAQDGSGILDITVPDVNLKADDRLSFLGKALVIHQAEDTGRSPSGDVGAAIACAVIEQD